MKLRPVRVANAFAISQAIVGVACCALTYLAPDFVLRVARSFAHPLVLDPLVPAPPWRIDVGEMLFGLAAWIVLAWISAWLFAAIFNGLSRGSEPTV